MAGSSKNKKVWLAAHLYYSGNSDFFIIKAIAPFIQQVLKSKKVKHYFFIRYWERGPHIRIRFKGNSDVLINEIKPFIIDFFQKYYDQYPSKRQDPEWVKDLPENEKWFPNNSIQFVEYEPEVERYGGIKAIAIAEEQFQASSAAIIKKMMRTPDFDYNTSLGMAIKLHLLFAKAMNMNINEMKLFFTAIAYHWFDKAYPHNIHKLSAEQKEELTKKIKDAFKNTFEASKTGLINLHRNILSALEAEDSFSESELNVWYKKNKKIAEKLEANKLLPGASGYHNYYAKMVGISTEKSILWMILESYVHMTNNRLGILNRDEAYLGYLIKESLANI